MNELALKGVRGHTDSWVSIFSPRLASDFIFIVGANILKYNGANIPGKPKEALNYAGGIPMYIKEIGKERDEGYPGFELR